MTIKPTSILKTLGLSIPLLFSSPKAQEYDSLHVPNDSISQYVFPIANKNYSGEKQDTTSLGQSLDSVIKTNKLQQSKKVETGKDLPAQSISVIQSCGDKLPPSKNGLESHLIIKYSSMFNDELGNSLVGWGISAIEGNKKYTVLKSNFNKMKSGSYFDLSLGRGIMWSDSFCSDLNLSFFGTTKDYGINGGVIPNINTFIPIGGNNYTKLGIEGSIGYMIKGRDFKGEGIVAKASIGMIFNKTK